MTKPRADISFPKGTDKIQINHLTKKMGLNKTMKLTKKQEERFRSGMAKILGSEGKFAMNSMVKLLAKELSIQKKETRGEMRANLVGLFPINTMKKWTCQEIVDHIEEFYKLKKLK